MTSLIIGAALAVAITIFVLSAIATGSEAEIRRDIKEIERDCDRLEQGDLD